MAFNIEDTREPEERIPVGHCLECENPVYNGDEVIDVKDGYICKDCKKEYALKNSGTSDFKEFLDFKDITDEFVTWFTEPNVKILEEETEDYE